MKIQNLKYSVPLLSGVALFAILTLFSMMSNQIFGTNTFFNGSLILLLWLVLSIALVIGLLMIYIRCKESISKSFLISCAFMLLIAGLLFLLSQIFPYQQESICSPSIINDLPTTVCGNSFANQLQGVVLYIIPVSIFLSIIPYAITVFIMRKVLNKHV